HRTIWRVGRIRMSRIALALGCLILSSAVEAAPRYSGTIVAVDPAGSSITLNELGAGVPGGRNQEIPRVIGLSPGTTLLREARAVQGVAELGFAAAGWPVADVGTPRLKGFAVRARRDLPILPLARQPHLDVVGLGRREPHVGCAEQHDPVRQLEPLQNFL